MIKRSLVVISILVLAIVSTSYAGGGTWNGWVYQDPYPTSLNLFDVKFVTPNKGWITGKYGSIFYTEDGGDTWEAQESGLEEDIMRIAFVNDKAGWAVGKQGSIIHTVDGGKTWVKQYSANALLTKVFFLDDKEGWVTGATPQAVVLHTKDGGKTWEKVETGINRAISSVYFVNSQTGWILAGEDVYRTTNGGVKWEKSTLQISTPPMMRTLGGYPGRRTMPGTVDMTMKEDGLGIEWWYGGIAFVNEKKGWAAVLQWIFYTDDGGKTWSIQFNTGKLDHDLRHISFKDERTGCASGWSIVCTEDGGKTWQERLGLSPGDDKMLGGISLTGESGAWTAGNFGQILKTQEKGRSWSSVEKTSECGNSPYFLNKKTGWLYKQWGENLLCRTDDGGNTWEKQDIKMKVSDMFFVDGLTGWAVGRIEEWKDGIETHFGGDRINVWSVIKHTIDGGKKWTTQYKESMGKEAYAGLKGLTFIDQETGWAVGVKGTILHTRDGGKHWERQKSGDVKFFLRSVHFIDSKVGWITGTRIANGWTGIILQTMDGGEHWNVMRSQIGVGFDDLIFMNGKLKWVSGEGEFGDLGVLMQTADSGKTWSKTVFKDIGLNRAAFLDKDHGVIYSIDYGITAHYGIAAITEDGGKSWSRYMMPLRKRPWHFSEIFEKQTRK